MLFPKANKNSTIEDLLKFNFTKVFNLGVITKTENSIETCTNIFKFLDFIIINYYLHIRLIRDYIISNKKIITNIVLEFENECNNAEKRRLLLKVCFKSKFKRLIYEFNNNKKVTIEINRAITQNRRLSLNLECSSKEIESIKVKVNFINVTKKNTAPFIII